jgi:hypothetical protein
VKRILYALFLLISSGSFATDWTFRPDSALRHSINLSSGYYFASDVITNNFALAFFQGEFIDDDLKNSVSKNLSSLNRFGTDLNPQLTYTKRNDTIFSLPHSFFSVSASSHYHVNSEFKKDVFEIFFRGNKNYAGEIAHLGDFNYNLVYYQQLNFTFGHNYKYENNSFEYSVGLSLNKGQNLYKLSAPTATLFTEENGEYIDLDTEIEIYRSDSSNSKRMTAWNGTGGSVDFAFSWKTPKNNVWYFSLKNFGFITWNDNTSHVKADTTFRFEGVDVSDLFDFSDSLHETITLDSSLVEPYLTVREEKKYTSPVPALASLSYQHILSPGKMDIEANIDYLFFAGYIPRESLTLGFIFNNTQRLTLKASYGGYTGFQAGIGYKVFLFQRWMLGVQSDYLTGWINPDKGVAQGAFVSLSAYF